MPRMTSRQRLLAAMHNHEVDCLPSGPFGLGHLEIDSPIAQELIERTDPFLPAGVWLDAALGAEAEVDVVTEGDVTSTIVHTPRGDLVRRRRKTDVAEATIEYPLKSIDDIDTLLSIPWRPRPFNTERYDRLKKLYDDQALVLADMGNAVAVPADWFGPERFCLYWATHRERMIEFTRVINTRLLELVKLACAQGITEFRLIGGEYVTVQLGPSAVRPLLIEPDRQVTDLLHEHGGVAFYHNHGPVMRYLEDFAEIGLDFLEPMEAPPWGDCDLAEAKRIIGDRYCMVGNLDDMEILEKLPTDAVLAIARQRIEEAGCRGFVLGGTASGTYTEKAARNFIAMAELAHGVRIR